MTVEYAIPDESQPYHFCTYFDCNYLTRGLALYHSLREHCQRPFVLWVLCFDDQSYEVLQRLNLANVRLITRNEFEAGDEGLAAARANRSPVEYYWTCTPSLPLYIFKKDENINLINYLDADLYFFSDPAPIFAEFGNGSILIIEHRYSREYAYLAEKSGIYNVGMMSFRRNGAGLNCLQWWREKCIEWCYARYEDNKFGDQKYLDDWPQRFDGVVVLQHPGANLAPWNISSCQVNFYKKNITVNNYPLIFYHFHGFKYLSPNIISPHSNVYSITFQQIDKIYYRYIKKLKNAAQFSNMSTVDIFATYIPLNNLISELLLQRIFLIRPKFISKVLWQYSGWRNRGYFC